MSQTKSSYLEEEVLSPDMFSEGDISSASIINTTDDSAASTSGSIVKPESIDNSPVWKGVPMDEIRRGFGPFDFEHLPPISPSAEHTVLFMLPLPNRGPPKPYPSHQVDTWNQDYVKLPQSWHSMYSCIKEDGVHKFRRRWEVIQEALLQNFYTSRQLEIAISSYNQSYAQRWDFKALHHFFSKVAHEEETEIFFNILLPKIIRLALQLPELLTGAIPLLKRHMNASISLSQIQVASLIANAFLCTFPRRNSSNPQSEYANYPQINFSRLFSSLNDKRSNRCKSVMEKLKCIFHYFRRVTSSEPEGTITIQRKYIPKEDCPKWATHDSKLPLLHITSKGTIESEGAGLLQVDFANKYVGGGVLNWGCVQEEIRFVICPELLVTMLVTEALDDTEALVICGVEQYSKYEGYSNNFEWAGNFNDETPRDSSGRRKTCIVAIDALHFREANLQFSTDNLTRELNKAYVGFVSREMPSESLCAIATGNWGCGAFQGNPKLKVLLQLIASAAAKRSVVYFTFGDTDLRDSVADMYWHLVSQNMNTAQLFSLLCQCQEHPFKNYSDFYRFLYNKDRIKISTKSEVKSVSQHVIHSPKTVAHPKQDLNKISATQDISTMKQKEEDMENMILQWLESSDEEAVTEKLNISTPKRKEPTLFENDDEKQKKETLSTNNEEQNLNCNKSKKIFEENKKVKRHLA